VNAWTLTLTACLAQADGPLPMRDPAPVPQTATARELVGSPRAKLGRVVVEDDTATPRPVPAEWVLPGYRVHVFASEELPVDALRSLVRPGVTLWLQTRSNMLRGSTLDTLRRAESAWVQLRPPLVRAHWEQLVKLPGVGVWVEAAALGDRGLERRGPHRLAVEVGAPVPLQTLRSAKPALVRWKIPVSARVATQVPGMRHLWEGLAPGEVCTEADPTLKLRVDAPWAAQCGHGVLAQVVRAEPAPLRALFVAQPAAELVVEVRDSEAAARGAATLLDLLDAAVGRGR
jgi:hypothetical protein